MPKPTPTAAADYPVPENDEDEIALEKALVTAKKRKLETVRDFLNGETAKAFAEGLAEINKARLPQGGSTKNNVAAMVANMATMTKAVEDEIAAAESVINPPAEPQLPGRMQLQPVPPVKP